MKKNHLKLLVSPKTKKPLKLEVFKQEGDELLQGKLYNAEGSWPLINGIPRLLSNELLIATVVPHHKEFFKKYGNHFDIKKTKKYTQALKHKINTANSFAYEWNKYKKIINIFDKDWDRYFNPFYYKKDMKKLCVADIGCGLAKHGYFTAKSGALYVGVDLSNAVESAYQNTKEFNALIVQSDIYDLAINGKYIDLYYSIGVIHHLPNPQKGFNSIVKTMKKNSKIFIWVYGRKNNNRAIYLYNPVRKITTKLPHKLLYYLCHIPAVATRAFNLFSEFFNIIGLKKLAKKIPFYYYADIPYSFVHNDCFDIFATPLQEYYYKKDIHQWYASQGLKKITIVDDIYQGIKAIGEK